MPFLLLAGDVLQLNVAQEAAAEYRYSLVEWEVENFLSKWLHRLATAVPGRGRSEQEKIESVREYFRLAGDYDRLLAERAMAASDSAADLGLGVAELERRIDRVRSDRDAIRDDVEEVLESVISTVVKEHGLASWGALIFPPVDFRLTDPPRVLITSPRDRIDRLHTVLLKSSIDLAKSQAVEVRLKEESDLSALVTNIGGLATYPASIQSSRSLKWTLEIASHEWLHHYFSFKPLGRNIFNDNVMQTLNETLADIAGREIGERALGRLDAIAETQPGSSTAPADAPESGTFDFFTEMQATRARVDELLAESAIEEAEAYMEDRRLLFVENGHNIRKLNQAYFAFHGSYGESPSSVSPIAGQLHEVRALLPDLGAFLQAVTQVSSYAQFLEMLDELRAGEES